MHVLIVNNTVIPALKYGGTERVIWWLGKALVKMRHKVSYLVAKGSHCPFADVYEYNPAQPLNSQVPAGVDVIHLNHGASEQPALPYIITMHGNMNHRQPLDVNTVFVSANHATRFGSNIFVHNGIDPEDYGVPVLDNARKYIHFLGDAAWRVKNVRGAIKVAAKARLPLHVVGGVRFNFNQGIRLTFSPRVHFYGMKGGEEKNRIINNSKAMLFPVRWHEPFGIAIIESLYFGCPVFATPYGSLPELVNEEVGFLSHSSTELAYALQRINSYSRQTCHEYVMDNFTAGHMAGKYVSLYEKVLNGYTLNPVAPILQQVQQEKFLPFN
ncbi:glycosyltransferase [Foetidibacter luteolus]|uniref:glycosyltransferase n=1 Tax=Foetidibacter luteolus TaxID=2608880 RepID=UPI00129AF0A5|nr:glycosyltransferase [Foetidibacter luteolus]